MKDKKIKIFNRNVIVLFFVLLLVFLFFSFFAKDFFEKGFIEGNLIHSQNLDVFFRVSDERAIGINVDKGSLNFGTLGKGNFAEKKLTIFNPYNYCVEVNLTKSKDVNEFLFLDEENFVLRPYESKKIFVVLNVPQNISVGNYSGFLKVDMRKIFNIKCLHKI